MVWIQLVDWAVSIFLPFLNILCSKKHQNMIIESSKYGNGMVVLLFDGDTPSNKEIKDYAQKYHGVNSLNCKIEIETPSDSKRLKNSGTIRITNDKK